MSDAASRARLPARGPGTVANPVTAPRRDAARARDVIVLVRLAAVDRVLQPLDAGVSGRVDAALAADRPGLVARLSGDTRELYDRALQAGRRPAVVSLVGGVCTGCYVRLHATLDQKVRRRRGVGACPHCLRLVYDPAWLPE